MKAGHSGRMKKHGLEAFEMKGLRKILRVSWTAKKTNEWVLNEAGVKEGTVRHCQSEEASILLKKTFHHQRTLIDNDDDDDDDKI